MRVLVALSESPGEVLTKPALLDAVWHGRVVGEEVLTRSVSELRRVLGDDPRTPRFIETIYKTGYRLIAEPRPAEPRTLVSAQSLPPKGNAPSTGLRIGRTSAWVWTGLTTIAVVAVVLSTVRLRATAEHAESAEATPPANGGAATARFEAQDLTPLTSYPGHEYGSAFSPDGAKIALVWEGPDGGDNYDIYVKRLDQEEPMRLTSSPAYEDDPAWSPDGEHIAFVRMGGRASGIFLKPLIGGAERRLVDDRFVSIDGLSFSLNGRFLAFGARTDPPSPSRIYRLDLATLAIEALSRPPATIPGDRYPAWSPDGRAIAFERSVGLGDEELRILDLGDGTPANVVERRIRHDRRTISGHAWLPDGRSLVFVASRTGYSQLWWLDLAGQATLLSGSVTRLMAPTVAPDGRTLAFTRKAVEQNIWQQALDGSDQPMRLIASTRLDLSPTFHPSGDTLAFVSYRSGHGELWLGDRDGSNLRQITRLGGPRLRFPRWSPDGSQLVLERTGLDSQDLLIIAVDTGEAHTLGGPPMRRTMGSWSHDGQALYFASDRDGRWQLWRQSVHGVTPERVTEDGGFASAETARGLFYTRHGQAGLWLRDGDGERRILDDLVTGHDRHWQVTSDAIYYVASGRPSRLVRLGLDDDERIEVHRFIRIGWDKQVFSIDPLGQVVVYGQGDRVESDVWSVAIGG